MQKDRLRGVNLGGWFSQVDCIEEKDPQGFPGFYAHAETFINRKDCERLVRAGFNHVRLPVDYFNFFKGESLEEDARAFTLLDNAIEMILSTGLSVILDLHKCPGHDFHLGCTEDQPFFSDPNCRRDARRVLASLSERYAEKQNVLFELLNEPAGNDSKVWDKIKDELFWEVRSHAKKNTIVVGSNRWNSAQEFNYLTPLDDDNVLYSFHSYTPVCFTHQFAAWIDDPFFRIQRSWPGFYEAPAGTAETRLSMDSGAWDIQRLRESILPALEFREKFNVPVACNEFGVYVQVERKSQMNWIKDFLQILREADVGFTYWNYKNLDFGLVSIKEKLHESLPQYDNPERLDEELLQLLANS